MSISLIGIILVQLYWINNALESKDAQFDNDVVKAMARASERLKEREQDAYLSKLEPIFSSKEFLSKAEIKKLFDTADRYSKLKAFLVWIYHCRGKF